MEDDQNIRNIYVEGITGAAMEAMDVVDDIFIHRLKLLDHELHEFCDLLERRGLHRAHIIATVTGYAAQIAASAE